MMMTGEPLGQLQAGNTRQIAVALQNPGSVEYRQGPER
jgi:hypothetical protein